MMNKTFLKLSFYCLTGGLSACSLLAPDRANPPMSLPSSWNESAQIAESNLAYIAWWQRFNDPQLNRLLASSLAHNTSIPMAKANIQQAQGQLRTVELAWIPQIMAFGGMLNMMPLLPQPQALYGIYAGYSSLNIFSQIANQKAAKLNLEINQQQLAGVKLDLIVQMVSGYYTLSAQQAEYKLYTQYIADLNERLKLQQQKHQGGLSSEQNGVSIEQSILQAKSQLKASENNILKSQNALNYLSGNNPTNTNPTHDFQQVNSTYANLAGLPATVIGNRPDVAVAALEYKYAAQNVTATYAQLLPGFQVGYGPAGGTNGGIPGTPSTYSTTYQTNFINWSLNPSLFGMAASASGAEQYAYANYIDTVSKALRDINDALATNRLTNERYQLLLAAEQTAQNKYKLVYAQYLGGLKAYADTLQNKTTWDEAKISLNQMKLAQFQAIITLYQDLGGGYRYFSESF